MIGISAETQGSESEVRANGSV